jgi:hypothetical protein
MLKLATKFEPCADALETAFRAGFRFAELYLDDKVLARWQTIVRQAQHYPTGYALHFLNRLDVAQEMLEAVVALYRGLDCSCMVIHEPIFDRHQQTLRALEPTLRLAVENHKLTPQGFTDWAERNQHLTLDVEHLWKFTLQNCPLADLLEQVRTFLARFGGKLRHVHMPGYWPGLDEHRPMYCSREMVFGVLSLLEQARFDGLIVSEVNTRYQNFQELRMDTLLFEVWRARHDPILSDEKQK